MSCNFSLLASTFSKGFLTAGKTAPAPAPALTKLTTVGYGRHLLASAPAPSGETLGPMRQCTPQYFDAVLGLLGANLKFAGHALQYPTQFDALGVQACLQRAYFSVPKVTVGNLKLHQNLQT